MIEFVEAKRENVNLLIGLAGQSGSGKTFSALRLAQGISPSGKIAFIDTEHVDDKRAVRYHVITPKLSKTMQAYWEKRMKDEG